MKKVLILVLVLLLTQTIVFAENEVDVTIPGFEVEIGGQVIDNERNAFPLIVYNDITYFPMTWNFSRALGLATDWQSDTGLAIDKTTDVEELKQDLSASNDLSKTYKAKVADFNIGLNGEQLDNSLEEFPILIFRDVTYFPLTWKFTVDEFGWESEWDQEKGLSIQNNNIQTTVNIDNSVNNTTTVSNVEDSSIVVTNNNIDNSVNNSNNVTNDYSTNITNNIDNSTSITTNEKLDDLLAEIQKLKESGVASGNLTVTFEVKDSDSDEAIQDAVIYMNNSPVGVTNEEGQAEISVYQYAQYVVKVEHADYNSLDIVEGYNATTTVLKELSLKTEVPTYTTGETYLITETDYEMINMEDLDVEFELVTERSPTIFRDDRFLVSSLERATDGDFIYFKLVYTSPIETSVMGMRIAPGVLDLNSFVREAAVVKEGYNVFIFRLKESTILPTNSNINLELGDEHSYQINYDVILDL